MATATNEKRKSFDKKDTGKYAGSKKSKKEEPPPANKRDLKHQRQSTRKHADVVSEAKVIWNKLRLKTNTAKQNRELMDDLVPLIEGKSKQIALQHDASRVVQAAIQFGTPAERKTILEELCKDSGNLVELAKSQYAVFCVLKAIKYCHTDAACVKMIVKALKGHMAKLAAHAVASRAVESLFLTMTAKQTVMLKQEFYGPHFALFAGDKLLEDSSQLPTLESNLALAPEKKDVTLDFVRHLVNKGVEKSLFGLTYFQKLFAEYVGVAPPTEIRALAASSADHAIHLLSTRSGTRVVAALTAYGTAKDRKRILKSLKGYGRSGLLHKDAYLAIIRLVQLTDDTVSVHKNLLNEILTSPDAKKEESPLLPIALSDTGSKLLCMLLIADKETRQKCFDPYEHSVLHLDPTIMEDGQEVPTCKKDAEIRRKELIKYLREPLIELSTKHTNELLRSQSGALLLREVYAAYHPQDLVKSLVKTCQSTFDTDTDVVMEDAATEGKGKKQESLSLFEDPKGHLAVKNLLLVDATSEEAPFASEFVKGLKGRLMDVAKTNRGAFVVAALLKISAVRNDVVKELKSQTKTLKQHAAGKGATAGFTALLKEIS
jgi:pumilio family protein 6